MAQTNEDSAFKPGCHRCSIPKDDGLEPNQTFIMYNPSMELVYLPTWDG